MDLENRESLAEQSSHPLEINRGARTCLATASIKQDRAALVRLDYSKKDLCNSCVTKGRYFRSLAAGREETVVSTEFEQQSG